MPIFAWCKLLLASIGWPIAKQSGAPDRLRIANAQAMSEQAKAKAQQKPGYRRITDQRQGYSPDT